MVAADWDEDPCWTLPRILTLIGRMFHLTVSIATVWGTLRRAGHTPQQPIHSAAERGEQAIDQFKRYQWPAAKGPRTSASPSR